MKIAFGCDHAGYQLKACLMEHLEKKGIQCDDLGGHFPEKIDYPIAGERVARAVAAGQYEKGIIICGTGVGISISANKVPGIRCVVCSEPYSAQKSVEHNNANMLALGERVVGMDLACLIVDTWLAATFEGGRHATRVDLIHDVEKRSRSFEK